MYLLPDRNSGRSGYYICGSRDDDVIIVSPFTTFLVILTRAPTVRSRVVKTEVLLIDLLESVRSRLCGHCAQLSYCDLNAIQ